MWLLHFIVRAPKLYGRGFKFPTKRVKRAKTWLSKPLQFVAYSVSQVICHLKPPLLGPSSTSTLFYLCS